MSRAAHLARLFLACAVSCVVSDTTARADDWPQWGGPQRDLVWRETGLVDKLPTSGLLPRVWATPIGEGYAGPAVADGQVYVTDFQRRANKERVLCLDADGGEIVWKHEYPVRYTIAYDAGPRSTPVVDAGRVYTIGAMGHLFCLDAATGDVIWKKDFVADFETPVPQWGMVASPLVDGNHLITLVGGSNGAMVVSFDKSTGKELWRALDGNEPGYCPPVLYTFGGTRQVIVWHPGSVNALDPQTGKVLWEFPWNIKAGLCVPMPRQIGNRLFLTAFYDGSLMLEIGPDGKSAEVAWRRRGRNEQQTDALHSIMPTPWVTETHIYGICSYGELRCLDATNGKRLWETREATGEGRWWNAFLVPHEDRFFLHNEQGDLIIAKLSPEGYDELSRAKLIAPTRPLGGQNRTVIWSHPAFAMQSVFARNDKEIVRVSLAEE